MAEYANIIHHHSVSKYCCTVSYVRSEQLIKSTADAMVGRGFLAAGYKYLVIDDCWMDRKRTSDGKLQGDVQRFPSGMPAIAQYVSVACPPPRPVTYNGIPNTLSLSPFLHRL